MRKKYLFIFIILSLLSCRYLFSGEEKLYQSSFSDKKPVLDGKLEEEFWKGIEEKTNFIILDTEKIAKKQTSFKIAYSKQAIYIGIRCEEPDMDKIVAQLKDEEGVWSEDSVEVFLFPDDERTYYQFVVNTKGYRFNEKDKLGSVPLWDWKAKVYQGKDFYSVELEIPFSILFSFPRKNNQVWRINIARNILTGPESEKHTCWPYLKGKEGFHNVENFAKIIFPQKISGEKVMAKGIPYYQKEIKENLEKISILQELLKENESSEEIKDYFEKCKELKKSFNEIHTPSYSYFSKLKFLLIESENLIAEGTKLKNQVMKLKEEKKAEHLLDDLF